MNGTLSFLVIIKSQSGRNKFLSERSENMPNKKSIYINKKQHMKLTIKVK